MELEQFGKQYEQILQEDSDSLESMARAHRAYGRDRRALLTKDDLDWIQKRKWDAAYDPDRRGVAGIRNFKSIKCLHAHAAHYWSGCEDNVVGKWVAKEVFTKLRQSVQYLSLIHI